jgi:hypothetical protein
MLLPIYMQLSDALEASDALGSGLLMRKKSPLIDFELCL